MEMSSSTQNSRNIYVNILKIKYIKYFFKLSAYWLNDLQNYLRKNVEMVIIFTHYAILCPVYYEFSQNNSNHLQISNISTIEQFPIFHTAFTRVA